MNYTFINLFAGFVNPTIELWKLAVESRSNFKKIWMYEDPKYSEEEQKTQIFTYQNLTYLYQSYQR